MPEALWDRQGGESSDAFAAFVTYRDLGPVHRSLAETARILQEKRQDRRSRLVFIDSPNKGKSEAEAREGSSEAKKRPHHPGVLGRWSRKWNWVERSQAWDDFIDKTRQNAYRDQVAKMAEEQSAILGSSRKVLGLTIASFVKSMRDEQRAASWNKLSAVELFEMSIEAMKVMPKILEAERIAAGVTVSLPEEDDSPQGGNVEWVVKTHQPPREGEGPDLSRFEKRDEAVHWEGDQPQDEAVDPAEGQPFPPSDHSA